jgi:hypothetical protein
MTGMALCPVLCLGSAKSHAQRNPGSSWSAGTGGMEGHLACSTLVPENSTYLPSRSAGRKKQWGVR